MNNKVNIFVGALVLLCIESLFSDSSEHIEFEINTNWTKYDGFFTTPEPLGVSGKLGMTHIQLKHKSIDSELVVGTVTKKNDPSTMARLVGDKVIIGAYSWVSHSLDEKSKNDMYRKAGIRDVAPGDKNIISFSYKHLTDNKTFSFAGHCKTQDWPIVQKEVEQMIATVIIK